MASLPGFASPAAGFDAPMDMLDACHDRVRRSCDLLARLAQRVAERRIDGAVRDAARDVLRYFDLAAPHHHEDEERHIFPMLLADPAAADVHATVDALIADHADLHRRWQRLRAPLAALAASADATSFDDDVQREVREFNAAYARHAELEETLVFPRARVALDAPAAAAMGAEMALRRGVRRVPPAAAV